MDFLVSDDEQYEAEPSLPTPPNLPPLSPTPAPDDFEAWERRFENGAFEAPDNDEDPNIESPDSTRSSGNDADSDTFGSDSNSFVLDLFHAEGSGQPPGKTYEN
jgi:hypothetical protein